MHKEFFISNTCALDYITKETVAVSEGAQFLVRLKHPDVSVRAKGSTHILLLIECGETKNHKQVLQLWVVKKVHQRRSFSVSDRS